MKHMTILALIACAVLGMSKPADAGKRLALVIGNAAYKSEFARTTTKDAELMAKTLEAVGFEVTTVTNAGLRAMKQSMAKFSDKLKQTDTVGLFYFAGRASEVAGETFLFPVDADIESKAKIDVHAVNVTAFLQTNSRNFKGFNIAILDVSRGSLLSRNSFQKRDGLARNKLSKRTFVGFATAPGGVSLTDDSGNSRYTAALVRAIATPGLSIDETFKRARVEVLKVTNREQTPWDLSSLKRNLSLNLGE